ncbi:hypothetical protein GCM10020000_77860 [Streptomyces olivoverticillatus]
MRRDTIFRMASTSKPVTMAAAMILLDECRLRLDDLVEQWLPELADRRVLKRVDGPLDDTVPSAAADHRTGPFDLHVRARRGSDVDGHPDHGRDLRAGRLLPECAGGARAG